MTAATIHGRFAEQARETPDTLAVLAGDIRLTFRELDDRANHLARQLAAAGVGAETPVAVLTERSPGLIVALLAILKTGACYVPIHEAYPPERRAAVIQQSMAPILLADEAMRKDGLPERAGALIVIADDMVGLGKMPELATAVDPDQLAYVIYTSGSTGQPKGVAVTHRDVLGLVADSSWDSGAHERVLMVAPHAFNVSTYEVWVPLLRGGTVVLAPPGGVDVAGLRRLIRDEEITAVHLTAGLFRVVADEAPDGLAGVREVLTGGDVIASSAVRRVLDVCPGLTVRAMYGATEGTVFSTSLAITAAWRPSAVVPVGKPMDNVAIHVLDERLSPVPTGVVGDVYIGGLGVARGYYGRPDLTAERFVADPFAETPDGEGQRMYRTGDLARWNDEGLLEYVGRDSDQVKILGFRVEPPEVEEALTRHPGVAHAAVVAREGKLGERRLIAYVVPHGELDAVALREHARELLPDYMVPAMFVPLESLPLTPNGKLNRQALPEPDFTSVSTYRPPQGELQEKLCAIFAEILDVPRVGIDDSFFDVGGQSLHAMRLMNQIHSVFGVNVPIRVLFDAPTVADLARHIPR